MKKKIFFLILFLLLTPSIAVAEINFRQADDSLAEITDFGGISQEITGLSGKVNIVRVRAEDIPAGGIYQLGIYEYFTHNPDFLPGYGNLIFNQQQQGLRPAFYDYDNGEWVFDLTDNQVFLFPNNFYSFLFTHGAGNVRLLYSGSARFIDGMPARARKATGWGVWGNTTSIYNLAFSINYSPAPPPPPQEPPPPAIPACDINNPFLWALCEVFVPQTETLRQFIKLWDDIRLRVPFGYLALAGNAITGALEGVPKYNLPNVAVFGTLKSVVGWLLWILFAVWLIRRIANMAI